MAPWIQLTKKEFRHGFPVFLVFVLGMYIGLGVLIIFFGMQWEAMLSYAVATITLNIFYLAYYMLYSLNIERKRMHLWLHNPLPSYKLLLAKFVSGLFYMFVFLLTIVVVIGIFYGNVNFSIHFDDWWEMILFLSIVYYFIFIVLVGWAFTFLWTVYMSLLKILSSFFSFVLTVVFVLFLFWMIDLLSVLFQWGEINNNVFTGFEFAISKDGFRANIGKIPMTFYIGHVVESLLLIVFFFIGSAWMLDRKVEV
ncbi:hypothetical protein [Fervidibacillus albus]|uniref:Uncharacterized protein n=1 Tax=Fervidibacillus albus TaxID=2980026 RepID=A0A9E8LT17_9BACI|nr:hypothetical protein [Fervidibacillus albus]WAA09085.1 hypothetical protein OE104_10860 [Fervidibacillus albus]